MFSHNLESDGKVAREAIFHFLLKGRDENIMHVIWYTNKTI
jgi:hypothetical protein